MCQGKHMQYTNIHHVRRLPCPLEPQIFQTEKQNLNFQETQMRSERATESLLPSSVHPPAPPCSSGNTPKFPVRLPTMIPLNGPATSPPFTTNAKTGRERPVQPQNHYQLNNNSWIPLCPWELLGLLFFRAYHPRIDGWQGHCPRTN
jgi:hypothetical protein